MSSFHVIINGFQKIVDPRTPQNDISKILLSFQKEISCNSFSQISDLTFPFKTFWEIFIEASKSQSTQVRLSLSPAVASFIVKLTPFCTEQMVKSFIDAIRFNEYHPLSSPLIVTAFSVLSKYVAPPLVHNFFTFSSIERHIKLDNNEFSEFTAKAIGDMEHFGIDWLEQLLYHFLDNMPEDPSRHIIRALGTIISYNPTTFLNHTIRILGTKPTIHMQTVGSLVASSDYDLRGIDISAFVDVCFDTLVREKATLNAIDSALQILAVYQDLEVHVDGDVVTMRDKRKSINVALGRLEDKIAFYKLKLPLSLLTPKEGDSVSLVARKFMSIGASVAEMSAEDRSLVVRLFEETIQKEYCDEVSSALRGLAKCIRILNVSNCVLKKVITGPKKSWFHSLDIVTVLEAMDVSMVEQEFAFTITNLLIDFCIAKNSQLAEQGMKLVTRFMTCETADSFVVMILSRMTLFETDVFIKVMEILRKVYHEYQDLERSRGLWVADVTLEMLEYHSHNVSILGSLFAFMSAFKLSIENSKVKRAVMMAHMLIVEYYEVITGKIWPSSLGIGECISMRQAVEKYLSINSVDLVSSSKFSTESMMRPLKSAMKFVFMFQSEIAFNWEVCQKMFVLEPAECSRFMLRNMSNLPMADKFVVESSKRLRFIGDIGTFSVWCRITELMKSSDASDTVSFLSVVACHYLHGKYITNIPLATKFCEFLSKMYENGKNEVTHFVERLSPSQRNQMVEHIKHANPILSEIVAPQLMVHARYKTPEFRETISDPEHELRYAFMTESDEHLNRVLEHCEAHDVTIPMNWLDSCPDKYIEAVTNYCMKCSYRALDMLAYSRTRWRKLALYAIESDSNTLLTDLSVLPKLKKSTLVDLCSCLGSVGFDRVRLMNLARLVFYEAKTPRRLRPAMRLFTCALLNMGSLSDVVIDDVVSAIRSRMPNVSLLEISFCILVLAKYVQDKGLIYPFVVDLSNKWDGSSIAKGNFYTVFLRFCCEPDEADEAERTIVKFVTSCIPSKYVSGIRQMREAIRIFGSETYRMASLLETIFSQYTSYAKIPGVASVMSEFVSALIDSRMYQFLHPQIVSNLCFAIRESPDSACFTSQLMWVQTAVSVFSQHEELMCAVNLFAKIRNIETFEFSMSVLNAHVTRIAQENTHGAVMEAFITFLNHHRDCESYFTRYYLCQFARLFEVHSPDSIVQFLVKAFHTLKLSHVIACLKEIVRRNSYGDVTREVFEPLIPMLCPQHQKEVTMLMNSCRRRSPV